MGESKKILFPWLLYSHGKDYTNKTLCNIASNTHQSSSIRALKNKTVLASSHGWLILKKKKKTENKSAADFYSLWNPITLESIDFPPFNSKPEHIFMSFLLSSPPGGDDDPNSMLLLFEASIPAIFVCRLSNLEWIELRYLDSSNQELIELSYYDDHLQDPVSYNGNVFAIGYGKILFRVEIKLDNSIILQPLIDVPDVPIPHSYFWFQNLVECCGELYTVYCTKNCAFGLGDVQREMVAIHVFKLNFSGMIWEKVDNIQDHAFFLSKNIAISCPAADLSSFPAQRNRIYFTMEGDKHKSLFFYHVEDGTLTMSRPCPDLPPPWIPPIWVTLPTRETNRSEQTEEIVKALVFDEGRKDNENNVFFPWTDLPMDLQTQIVKKLPPFDYMNFRAICRMNSIIAPPIQWRTKLAGSNQLHLLSPCLIYSPIGKNVCSILDPNLNGRYLVKTPELFQDPFVRCCKESWLLMSESKYSEDYWLSMFLFNPFTKATIQLPDLKVECIPAVRFYLTSLPDSSGHCYVVCFLNRCKRANFLVTSPGSEEWTFHEFLNDTENFCPIDNSPVFLNGTLYYLGVEAKLGTLTIVEQEWSWDVWDVQGRPDDFQQNYLVECNGRLLSVFVGHCGKWVKVFKLCECEGGTLFRLEPVLDLGNHVLYLSRLSTVSKVAQVEGTENRIYLERLYREKAMFYSLRSQKFHTSDGKDSLTSYYNTSAPLLCAWIQPYWCDKSLQYD